MTASLAVRAAATIRSAEPRDFDEIVALEQTAWPTELGNHLLCDPWFAWDQFRLVEVNGQIVSMLKIFRRSIAWHGDAMLIGGIGDVVTHPAHRGKGYASMAIEDAIRYMRDGGYKWSILFTELTQFYRQFGWEVLPQLSLHVSVGEDERATKAPSDGLRNFSIDDHLDDVARIYADENATRQGTLRRTDDYWRSQYRYKDDPPHASAVAVRDGQVVAYARALYSARQSAIEEYGCLPGQDAALRALVQQSLARARESGSPSLEIPAPPGDSRILAILRELGAAFQTRTFTGTMVRAIAGRSAKAISHSGDETASFFYWPSDRF